MPNRKAKLLKLQLGKCPWCGLSFQEWDVLEVDHKIPRALRGKDEYKKSAIITSALSRRKDRNRPKRNTEERPLQISRETFSILEQF